MQNESTTTTTETNNKFSALDAIAMTLDQPRGWKSFVAKNAVQGVFTAVAFIAINAGVKKVQERRNAKLELLNGGRKVS